MALKERCTRLLVTTIISVLASVHTVVSQGECNSSSLLATESPKYITSPNYPSNYSIRTDCRWHITAASSSQVIMLYVLDLYLEDSSPSCPYDYVNILNGTGLNLFLDRKLCGQIYNTRQFMSTGPSMEVVFHSDGSGNYRGFKIEYTSSVVTSKCNYTLWATGTPRYLTSPNYPSDYSSLTDCQWFITAVSPSSVVVLKVLDLNVEGSPPSCTEDHVIIYDGPSTSSPQIKKLCDKMLITHQLVSTGPNMTVVFHSDGSVQHRGFVFEYTSKDKTAKFNNGTFTAYATSQYISSPNYPFNYSSNTDCQWLFTAPSHTGVVVIKLLDFYVDWSSSSCSEDYLSIHNGPDTSSPIIQKLCGQFFTDQQFKSNGSNMTVVFHSDASSNYRGFKLEYFSQKNPDLCKNKTLQASESPKYVTSPNYPSYYSSNTDCQWIIKAASSLQVVVLRVEKFNFEELSKYCYNDYVIIYDGPNTSSARIHKLCGVLNITQPFVSTGSSMTVVFHAKQNKTGDGFKFAYTSQNKSDVTAHCKNETLLASSISKNLTSPNYPSDYLSNMDCQWNINAASSVQVVVLRVLGFILEGVSPSCDNDYVIVYDGANTSSTRIKKLCGVESITKPFVSTGPSMTVVFHSNEEINNKGFMFAYTSQRKSDQCKNETLLAFGYSKYLTSPNYPLDYPSNMNCQWSIKAASSLQVVVLKVLNFTLGGSLSSCNKDYVVIYDGNSTGSPILATLCGYVSRKTIISTGSYMTVLFHSDETRAYSGFKFEFFTMDKTASCTATILTANRTVNYLTPSDYYSRFLSNIYCHWLITADSYSSLIVLDLKRLRFEVYQPYCISDCVKIYDGHSTDSIPMTIPCGSGNYRSFVSTSSDMTVVYHSVGQNCTDVSFTYQTQELQITRDRGEGNTNKESADTQYTCFTRTDVKYFASGVGCSLIVTFLTSISVLCILRRKLTQLKNNQSKKTAPDVRNNPLFMAGVGSKNRDVPPIEESQDWQDTEDESLYLNPNLYANSSLVSAPPVNKPQFSSLPGGKFNYTHGHDAQEDDLYECISANATPTRQAKLPYTPMHADQRPIRLPGMHGSRRKLVPVNSRLNSKI